MLAQQAVQLLFPTTETRFPNPIRRVQRSTLARHSEIKLPTRLGNRPLPAATERIVGRDLSCRSVFEDLSHDALAHRLEEGFFVGFHFNHDDGRSWNRGLQGRNQSLI